jgi:hypothetical protein
MAPTPTIVPWPCMSRGTDCFVPMVPGLVRVTVAPAKSSTVSLLDRVRRMSSSYVPQKARNSIVSASRMTGTTRLRLPSDRSRSTARPNPTCSWRTTRGLPSSPLTNVELITGMVSAMARTMA